ncbi:MAG: hypothetical protein ABWY16_02915 [Pedobacter sp.]|uniref:hypothetical protein n=1 Tax=Pedobacter sp. TaxID=1411316 RepID=UPI00339165D2
MRLIIAIFALATGAGACTPAANYKTERDEVMKFHDVVMEDHGKLVDNQMKLDTLLKSLPALKTKYPSLDTTSEKEVMKETLERLNTAEHKMNDWMHKFEPDVTGKSDAEAVAYFKGERIKIGTIDSIYKAEIRLSGDYISQFRK